MIIIGRDCQAATLQKVPARKEHGPRPSRELHYSLKEQLWHSCPHLSASVRLSINCRPGPTFDLYSYKERSVFAPPPPPPNLILILHCSWIFAN